jgi:hypothetical protein
MTMAKWKNRQVNMACSLNKDFNFFMVICIFENPKGNLPLGLDTHVDSNQMLVTNLVTIILVVIC